MNWILSNQIQASFICGTNLGMIQISVSACVVWADKLDAHSESYVTVDADRCCGRSGFNKSSLHFLLRLIKCDILLCSSQVPQSVRWTHAPAVSHNLTLTVAVHYNRQHLESVPETIQAKNNVLCAPKNAPLTLALTTILLSSASINTIQAKFRQVWMQISDMGYVLKRDISEIKKIG